MPRRSPPLPGTLVATLVLTACATEGPLWVRKGYDPHADPVEAGLSAVGSAGGEPDQPPMEANARRAAADTAARTNLSRQVGKLVPDECRKTVSMELMRVPITAHWVDDKGKEYSLTEVSQGTLWEICPAMIGREIQPVPE